MENTLIAIKIGLNGYLFLIGVLFVFFILTKLFVKLFSRGEKDGKK